MAPAQPLSQLLKLGLVDLSVPVGVELIKASLHPFGQLFLGEYPIVVGVGLPEPLNNPGRSSSPFGLLLVSDGRHINHEHHRQTKQSDPSHRENPSIPGCRKDQTVTPTFD